MNYIKKAIYGPDPAEQKRKCKALIRKNQRDLDKQLHSLTLSEQKTKTMIKLLAKRQDEKSARALAKELYNAKKQRQRLNKSKAQLNSIGLQVDEAFALRKIEGTMKSSTVIMKEMNSLIRIPELMSNMNALGQELVKAGIIEEMVSDTFETLDENDMLDSSDVEAEVNDILFELTGTNLDSVGAIPDKNLKDEEKSTVLAPSKKTLNEEEDEEDEEEDEEMLNSMRERLKALQT